MDAHGNVKQMNSFTPGTLKTAKKEEHSLTITCDNDTLYRIEIMESGLVRFRHAPNGYLEDDFSYAIDPKFKANRCPWELVEFGDGIAIRTSLLSIRISRQGLKTTISCLESGKILCADDKGFHWMENRDHEYERPSPIHVG